MNGLRRRVDALLREYAREVAVVRLRRLTQEYSLQWTVAVADRQPTPLIPTPLFCEWPTPDSGSPPSCRSVNTWKGAAAKTPFPKRTKWPRPFSLGTAPRSLSIGSTPPVISRPKNSETPALSAVTGARAGSVDSQPGSQYTPACFPLIPPQDVTQVVAGN